MVKQKPKATPPRSRTPFFILLLAIAAAGASGLYYAIKTSVPKPIELAPGAALPTAEGYLRGSPDAPVTIIEFADFECPGCGQFATVAEPDVRTRIIDAGLANMRYYDFPLTNIHANTMAASLAAACANEQGKFWEMHDVLFQGQLEWNSQATTNPKKVFNRYVKSLALDEAKWNTCYDTQKFVPDIMARRDAGIARGVGQTPSFIIGDRLYPGMSYDQMKSVVDSLVAAKKAATPAEAPPPAPKKP